MNFVMFTGMSDVVTFKVSRELKERMKRFKDRVNWSAELRKFVENKLKELEAEQRLELVAEELKRGGWSVPKGFSSRSVRGDRERR